MEKSEKRMRSRSEKIVLFVVFVVFMIYAVSLFVPFLWAFISSLKTDDRVFRKSVRLAETMAVRQLYQGVQGI